MSYCDGFESWGNMFKNNDRVQFHSTGNEELDSLTGTIKGIVSDFAEQSFYIVALDKQHSEWDWDSISMTSSYLRLI